MKLILLCAVIVSVSLGQRSKSFNNFNPGTVSTCNCGWRNSGRIVGGKETLRNEYPWMARIESVPRGCGGAIITPFHVLTTAHCADGLTPDEITISVGRHNLLDPSESTAQYYSVARIIQHKDFKPDPYINDVSVLLTSTEISFNQNVGPVCLPNKRFDLVRKEMKAIGWGTTGETGDRKNLHEVDLGFVPLDECKKSWPGLTQEETQICAYGQYKDTCKGDSGGPLVYLNSDNNRYYQVALVSYGHSTCGSEYPSVNTDVFVFMDWINGAISESMQGVKACTG